MTEVERNKITAAICQICDHCPKPFIEKGMCNSCVVKNVADEHGITDYGYIKEGKVMTIAEMWEKLLGMGVSEETLKVVTDINGYNEESMQDILYVKFGYHSFDQLYD